MRRNFDDEWNGDVWKSVVHLRSLYKNINVFVLDTDFGIGIISKRSADSGLNFSPDQIEAVKKSATLVNQLPKEIRDPIIAAYVNSLRSAFTALIPIGIICFICSLFMGSHRPKISKGRDTIMIIE